MRKAWLLLFGLAVLAAACSGTAAPSDAELNNWAAEVCVIHHEVATALSDATSVEGDPATLAASERLTRAERIGEASIQAFETAATSLRRIDDRGQLKTASEARARYYDARAEAWQTALDGFAANADQPDFDAANAGLESAASDADAKWKASLNGLDPFVRFAALKAAACT